ncbi:MAG: ZIP family metal transporter [Flavobacteriaceae bacterium]|nr:ZIP family metal transporter [Flavobacteriaceae bacterium]
MIFTLLILSVLSGVFLGKFFGNNEKLAKRLLVLSAGFLIAICVVEVFPQVYHAHDENIGLWIILGILLQMFLESLTKGFEHGHFHYEKCQILPVGLILGMFIHAFLEGIPLAHEEEISPYLLGILVHNLPISFVLGAFLLREKKNLKIAWITISLFAIASPLGILFGDYFPADWRGYFLALSGGIFLHISSVIIFESNKSHKMDWEKMLLVVLGIAMALSGHLFHEHGHHH